MLFNKKNNSTNDNQHESCINILYDKYEFQMQKLNQKMQNINNQHIIGSVVFGNKKNTGNFSPTANVYYNGITLKDGFYQSFVNIEGSHYKSLTLVEDKTKLTKTYIFDFNTNILGKTIDIEIIRLISTLIADRQIAISAQFKNNIEIVKKMFSN